MHYYVPKNPDEIKDLIIPQITSDEKDIPMGHVRIQTQVAENLPHFFSE